MLVERSKIYSYCKELSSGKVEHGRQKGKKYKIVKCTLGQCIREVKLVNGSTSAFVRHLCVMGKAGCETHQAAYESVISNSMHTNKALTSDGIVVKKLPFMELFEANCATIYLFSEAKIAANILRSEVYRAVVAAYRNEATVMCKSSAVKMATSISAVVDDTIASNVKRMKARFEGSGCCGVQIDIWSDNQGRSWAAATWTRCEWSEAGVLELISDVLWVGLFPYLTHTIPHLKAWLLQIFKEKGLDLSMLLNITPDNAYDVMGACRAIPELALVVQGCAVHGLARDLLAAMGMSGKGESNPEARALLKTHGRYSQLYNQSKNFRAAVNTSQLDTYKRRKALILKGSNTVRWNGRAYQTDRNNDLSPNIDEGMSTYRCAARNEGQESVEFYHRDVLEDDGETTNTVPLRSIGFSPEGWEESYEFEGVYKTAETTTLLLQKIFDTAADQKYWLLGQLRKTQISETVRVLGRPEKGPTISRPARMVRSSTLCPAAKKFREVLYPAMEKRHFEKCPIDAVLIMIALGKQVRDPLTMLPQAEWRARAEAKLNAVFIKFKGIYDRQQGAAAAAEPVQKKAKKMDPTMALLLEHNDMHNDIQDEGITETELQRWRELPSKTVDKHRSSNGLVNYFTLISDVKADFPVIALIFEAYLCTFIVSSNLETHFSHMGQLQDDTKKMSATWLQMLSNIKGQTKKPSTDAVKAKYIELFGTASEKAGAAEIAGGDSSDDGTGSESDDDGEFDERWQAPTCIDATEPRLEDEVGDENEAEAANLMAAELGQS